VPGAQQGETGSTGETQNLVETRGAEGIEDRGNPSGDRRHSRRAEDEGQPEESDAGSAKRERSKGQPRNETRAEREDAGGGATRTLIGRQNETMQDPMS